VSAPFKTLTETAGFSSLNASTVASALIHIIFVHFLLKKNKKRLIP